MFEQTDLLDKEYTDAMFPASVYESGNIVHEAAISHLVGYYRSIDKKFVLCSADIAGRVSFSILTQDKRIELSYKNPQAHYNAISRVYPLGKSPFVATFAPNEPVKIWNTVDKYLSLIINQFKVNSDLDFCLCDNSQYAMIIGAGSNLESHKLEYTNVSKNVFDLGVLAKRKVLQSSPTNVQYRLESPNRIELPYLSLLVAEEETNTIQVFILSLGTLETLAVKSAGGFTLLKQPGLYSTDLANFKDVGSLEYIDSWEEYYSNVRVLLYDQIKGDLLTYKLETRGAIELDQRLPSIGCYSGKPVMVLDLLAGDFPHLRLCADVKLEYLCISGSSYNSGGPFDEDAIENAMQLRARMNPPVDTDSKSKTSKVSAGKSSSKTPSGANSKSAKTKTVEGSSQKSASKKAEEPSKKSLKEQNQDASAVRKPASKAGRSSSKSLPKPSKKAK
jgi:hypothetical protein